VAKNPALPRLRRNSFVPNIAIIWDFDGTLTPQDSTTVTVETITGKKGKDNEFWHKIKDLRGDRGLPKWEHILAMDAPIWTYSLSRLASKEKIPLNKEFFREFVVPKIELYPHVEEFLRTIKSIEDNEEFSRNTIRKNHNIISTG
jgi:FMN phosphatase YigB (HAD superfamily)